MAIPFSECGNNVESPIGQGLQGDSVTIEIAVDTDSEFVIRCVNIDAVTGAKTTLWTSPNLRAVDSSSVELIVSPKGTLSVKHDGHEVQLDVRVSSQRGNKLAILADGSLFAEGIDSGSEIINLLESGDNVNITLDGDKVKISSTGKQYSLQNSDQSIAIRNITNNNTTKVDDISVNVSTSAARNILTKVEDGLYVPQQDPNLASTDGSVGINKIGGTFDLSVKVDDSDENIISKTNKGIFAPKLKAYNSETIRFNQPSAGDPAVINADVKIDTTMHDNCLSELPTGLYVSPSAVSGNALPTDITSSDFVVGGATFNRTINLKPEMAQEISTISSKIAAVTHSQQFTGDGTYGNPLTIDSSKLDITQGMGIAVIKNGTGLTIADRLSTQEGNVLIHGVDGGLYVSAEQAGAVSNIESTSGTLAVSNVGGNVNIGLSATVLAEISRKISKVEHDSTLIGDGTAANPLSVVNGAGVVGLRSISSPARSIRVYDGTTDADKNIDVRVANGEGYADNVLTLTSNGLYVPFAGSGLAGLPTNITSGTLEVGGSGFDKTIDLSESTLNQLDSITSKLTTVHHDNTLSGKGTTMEPLHADIDIVNVDGTIDVTRIAEGNQLGVHISPKSDNALIKIAKPQNDTDPDESGLYVATVQGGGGIANIDSPKDTISVTQGTDVTHIDVDQQLVDKVDASITSVTTDGLTVIGDGTAGNPLVALGGGEVILAWDLALKDYNDQNDDYIVYQDIQKHMEHTPNTPRIDFLPDSLTLMAKPSGNSDVTDAVKLYKQSATDTLVGQLSTLTGSTNLNKLRFQVIPSTFTGYTAEGTIATFVPVDADSLLLNIQIVSVKDAEGLVDVRLITRWKDNRATNQPLYGAVSLSGAKIPQIPEFLFPEEVTVTMVKGSAKTITQEIVAYDTTIVEDFVTLTDAQAGDATTYSSIGFEAWTDDIAEDKTYAVLENANGKDLELMTTSHSAIQGGMPTQISSPSGTITVGGEDYAKTVDIADTFVSVVNSKIANVRHDQSLLGDGTSSSPLKINVPEINRAFVPRNSIAPQRQSTLDNENGTLVSTVTSAYGNKAFKVDDKGITFATSNVSSEGSFKLYVDESQLGLFTGIDIFSDYKVTIGGQDSKIIIDPDRFQIKNLGTLTDSLANDVTITADDGGFVVASGYGRIPTTFAEIRTFVAGNGVGSAQLTSTNGSTATSRIDVSGDTATVQSAAHRLQVKPQGLYWDDMPVDLTTHGIGEAPMDGSLYGRSNGIWSKIDEDAFDGIKSIQSSNLEIMGNGDPLLINIPSQTMGKISQIDSKLSFVATDASITGSGTTADPLRVVQGSTVENTKVTNLNPSFTASTKLLHIDLVQSDSSVVSGEVTIPYPDSVGGGGIEDAPSDGHSYARKNATWAAIPDDFVELITSTGTITVSNIPQNPNGVKLDVDLSNDNGNAIKIGSDGGLWVDAAGMGGGTTSTPTDITSPSGSLTVGGSGYSRTIDLSNSLLSKISSAITGLGSSDKSITVSGSGSSKDITVNISNADDNALGYDNEGALYVPAAQSTGGDGISVLNSPNNTMNISGTGSSRSIDVRRSGNAGNVLEIRNDGLYVPTQGGGGTSTPTNVTALDASIHVEGADFDKKLKVQVKSGDNGIVLTDSGLWVDPTLGQSGISNIASDSLDVTGTGDTRKIELKTADKNAIAAVPNKLSTVAVDGTTIVGDGTTSNPLTVIGGGGGTPTTETTRVVSNTLDVSGSGTNQVTINLKQEDKAKIDSALTNIYVDNKGIVGTGASDAPLHIMGYQVSNSSDFREVNIGLKPQNDSDVYSGHVIAYSNQNNNTGKASIAATGAAEGDVVAEVSASSSGSIIMTGSSVLFNQKALLTDVKVDGTTISGDGTAANPLKVIGGGGSVTPTDVYTKAEVDALIASAIADLVKEITSSSNTVTVTTTSV